MAKHTRTKKRTQLSKTPRRRSTRIAVLTNPRHPPNDAQLVDTGPQSQAVEPALHRGRREFADSSMTGTEVVPGVRNLETGTIRHVVIRTLTRPLRKVLHQSISFLSYIWQGTSKTQALQRGRDFASSIMSSIQEIPRSNGMGVIRGVTSMETGTCRDIIIRSITRPFWQECIDEVKTPDMRYRVCVVGTPGIGKTTSTAFLIRMLFEEKQTVVYRLQSEDYFWEFTWNDEGYVVSVHPERYGIWMIESLTQPSTFYIVDPGSSRKSCLPPTAFKARTIIVSSPNERHWEGNEFYKQRDDVCGIFKFFPMWDLKELVEVRGLFQGTVHTDEELEERFRQVGGVPRHIFSNKKVYLATLQLQKDAISALTAQQAAEIAQGNIDVVGSFASSQPKSAIIGYAKIQDGESSFWPRKVEIISPSVAEKVFAKFMSNLWSLMLQDDKVGWKIFEAYCRQLMATPPARSFRCRSCCRKRDNEYRHERDFVLGGCNKVRMGLNVSSAVFEGDSMTLFHSFDPRHKLFDFIYKDIVGTFHAFQVTLGKKHHVDVSHIQELRGMIGNSRLVLYYMVPADRFNGFVTTPTNPLTDGLTSVWYVLIPNPNAEQTSNPGV